MPRLKKKSSLVRKSEKRKRDQQSQSADESQSKGNNIDETDHSHCVNAVSEIMSDNESVSPTPTLSLCTGVSFTTSASKRTTQKTKNQANMCRNRNNNPSAELERTHNRQRMSSKTEKRMFRPRNR